MKKFHSLCSISIFSLLLFFSSCQKEDEISDIEQINSSNFLKDYDLSENQIVVSEGKSYNLSDPAQWSKAKNLLDQSHTISVDEDYIFVYDESTSKSADFETLDHYKYNNIENGAKASNPILYTVRFFVGKSSSGKSFQFSVRRKLFRSGNSRVIRLKRFQNGIFNDAISSLTVTTTPIGKLVLSRTDLLPSIVLHRDNNINNEAIPTAVYLLSNSGTPESVSRFLSFYDLSNFNKVRGDNTDNVIAISAPFQNLVNYNDTITAIEL